MQPGTGITVEVGNLSELFFEQRVLHRVRRVLNDCKLGNQGTRGHATATAIAPPSQTRRSYMGRWRMHIGATNLGTL